MKFEAPDLDPSLKGKPLVDSVIDPEIRRFEAWFAKVVGPLGTFEEEVLRSYLYWKLRPPE